MAGRSENGRSKMPYWLILAAMVCTTIIILVALDAKDVALELVPTLKGP